jgi:hypothetical protein
MEAKQMQGENRMTAATDSNLSLNDLRIEEAEYLIDVCLDKKYEERISFFLKENLDTVNLSLWESAILSHAEALNIILDEARGPI